MRRVRDGTWGSRCPSWSRRSVVLFVLPLLSVANAISENHPRASALKLSLRGRSDAVLALPRRPLCSR